MNNQNIVYKYRPALQHAEKLRHLYPEYFTALEDIKTLTFQVTEDCCLNCSYCYQVHGPLNNMQYEDIEPWLKKLLNDEVPRISTKNTKAVIFDFIGGEPFLQIKLITKITNFIFNTMVKKNHPWLKYLRFCFSSNGLLYFEKEVQDYLSKYGEFTSLGISLDGNKELHDKCRLDLEGKGSYDRVIAAVRAYKHQFGDMPGIKMTFSSENISNLTESYKYLISEGYRDLLGNCVFEDVWEQKDATILYYQLKELADYIIDNDLYNSIYISFFEEDFFHPQDESENDNWCGGINDCMFAIDGKGEIYRCIRYMDSSLKHKQKALPIGNIITELDESEEYQNNRKLFQNITRRSQSTDECFYCPISAGCAWCSGYNYEVTGSVNKRVTFICIMHKARCLANVYYWNKLFNKLNLNKQFINYLPDEESLKIIPKEELSLLHKLSRR